MLKYVKAFYVLNLAMSTFYTPTDPILVNAGEVFVKKMWVERKINVNGNDKRYQIKSFCRILTVRVTYICKHIYIID